MEVVYKNKNYTLSKKERKVGGEAPAVRTKMLNGEIKVIGMMGPKVQVMLALPQASDFTAQLQEVVKQYESKTLPYIITSDSKEKAQEITRQYDFDEACISVDFQDFANKFGVNMEDEYIAKSLFIIDKEGEITYISRPSDAQKAFDINEFKDALHDIVTKKVKGHTHENWMGV